MSHNDYASNSACMVLFGILPLEAVLHKTLLNTVELQWLERLWNHENMFETGVIRDNEGLP